WGTAYGLLVDQLVQMGYTRDEAVRLAEQYRAFPRFVDTQVRVNTSGASWDLDNWYQRYNGRTLTAYQVISAGGRAYVATGGDVDAHAAAAGRRLAGGGPVVGPGTGTSDDVPATHPSGVAFALSNGEHVWTDAEVKALGGHAGVYELRDMALSGELSRLLDSGVPTVAAPSFPVAGAGGGSAPVVAGAGGGVDAAAIGAAVGEQLSRL